ncbi:MAG: FeoA family protein [Bacteroidota bacterium]|jgi:Fe2+ transport system protein FeoA
MTPKQKTVPLILVRAGNLVKIISVPKGALRAQFIRLGISEGERVTCLERLPGGTIVIQKNRQQIALGHKLAREILVQVEQPSSKDSPGFVE